MCSVTPLAINDVTSGFNIAEDWTFNSSIEGICGLTTEEVKDLLNWTRIRRPDGTLVRRLTNEEKDEHLQFMKENYKGYRFSHKSDAIPLYCTVQVMSYLKVCVWILSPRTLVLVCSSDAYCNCVFDEVQHVETASDEYFGDPNVEISDAALEFIISSPHFHEILDILKGKQPSSALSVSQVHRAMGSFRSLNWFDKERARTMDAFLMLSMYLGVLTISDHDRTFPECEAFDYCVNSLLLIVPVRLMICVLAGRIGRSQSAHCREHLEAFGSSKQAVVF